MKLVVVESPAKAKTIETYLGPDYRVLASYGHVRDLPAKDGSVDPEQDFAMLWEVDDKAAKRLSEIVRAQEGLRMFLTDVEVLRLHYAWTLKEWYRRVVANRDAIVALYDERFYRMWSFYLAGAAMGFEHGGLVNYQLQFSRSRTALPVTRDYMLEGERALRRSA